MRVLTKKSVLIENSSSHFPLKKVYANVDYFEGEHHPLRLVKSEKDLLFSVGTHEVGTYIYGHTSEDLIHNNEQWDADERMHYYPSSELILE